MAIARGAGTEIIRSVLLEDVNATGRNVIFGEQHHIYTILNITVFASAIQANGNFINCNIKGYDVIDGTSQDFIAIFKQDMGLAKTFVWDTKFSFNGHEPIDFTGPLDSVAKQDAIADQGSSVPQLLIINAENPSDGFDVTCTYIDQNNA